MATAAAVRAGFSMTLRDREAARALSGATPGKAASATSIRAASNNGVAAPDAALTLTHSVPPPAAGRGAR
jgi:hypothetical protein